MPSENVLEARRLAARRGHAQLFTDIDFSIHPGEAMVVTGPNGIGKTTLLRIVAALTSPVEGDIRWRGERVHPFDERLRAAVAFNGHSMALKDELTAEENLAAWIALDDRRAARDELADALETVGLLRQRGLPVRVLSQGQRRRIGLARLALVSRPFWILDEPLTALDADAVALFGALLGAHVAEGGLCAAASHQPLPIPATHVRHLVLGAGA